MNDTTSTDTDDDLSQATATIKEAFQVSDGEAVSMQEEGRAEESLTLAFQDYVTQFLGDQAQEAQTSDETVGELDSIPTASILEQGVKMMEDEVAKFKAQLIAQAADAKPKDDATDKPATGGKKSSKT